MAVPTLKIRYTCTDDSSFETETEALAHEEHLYFESMAEVYGVSNDAARYIVSAAIDHNDLYEVSYWGLQIAVNEEEAMMKRYTKRLGIVHGSLIKAINYAVSQKGFSVDSRRCVIKKVDIIELL